MNGVGIFLMVVAVVFLYLAGGYRWCSVAHLIEFELPLPGGSTIGRSDDVLAAFRPLIK
ncbi:Uncharacterised protein [Escherichia coli]|uniref:Uncharacterized protein n=1 Tax=Escherichia coli TaxID=562 RepID=A0AAX2KL44_ECOLX|nr:Uncharacterised protein [Escherichia coli]